MSLLGPITVSAAYYHCRRCRCGHKPWENALRLKQITLTPASEEIVALAGMPGSFADGAERVLRTCAPAGLSSSVILEIVPCPLYFSVSFVLFVVGSFRLPA